MNSIDNLREYVLTAPSICSTTRAILVGYIDEIEREVEELRDREYRNGMEDGEMAAERDGWVRLPVDAEGVPWRVGDMTENGNVVNGMTIDFHGWHFTGTRNDIDPAIHRHYVPKPTVEDVLAEFAERWHDAKRGERTFDYDELIAEYAAKLRLAGEDE